MEVNVQELILEKGVAAWLDPQDFVQFGHRKWRQGAKGVPCRDGQPWTGREGLVYLPRLIMGVHSGQVVRHRNNIPLDCRRENLVVEPRTGKPGRFAARENLSAIVMRFAAAFPAQTRFGLRRLRDQLAVAKSQSGLDAPEFLDRIDGWAAARSNIAPWDLEKAAPTLEKPVEIDAPLPTIVLPEPSAQQRAMVRALQSPWSDDGTT
jgi:hypothetical protein